MVLRSVIKAEKKEKETMGANEEKVLMVKQEMKALDKIFTVLNARQILSSSTGSYSIKVLVNLKSIFYF